MPHAAELHDQYRDQGVTFLLYPFNVTSPGTPRPRRWQVPTVLVEWQDDGTVTGPDDGPLAGRLAGSVRYGRIPALAFAGKVGIFPCRACDTKSLQMSGQCRVTAAPTSVHLGSRPAQAPR